MRVTVLYVGSSLLAPLRQAENEIEKRYALGLRIAAYNFGAPLDESVWRDVERDVSESEVVFVLHVTDGENATRLLALLKREEARRRTIVVINCMPDLMRQTRMGRLKFGGESAPAAKGDGNEAESGIAKRLAQSVGAWMGEQVRARRASSPPKHTQYLRLIERLPGLLRVMPSAGRLRDAKHYLYLFCYFLQPTPANIRSMLLYALKHYSDDARVRAANVATPAPESMPAVAIYHPDAPALFETFGDYRKWHRRRNRLQSSVTELAAERTIGLLLMRPQIVSGARGHYDGLIRAIEAEGLSVIPAISTFMDNREACGKFFVEVKESGGKKAREAGHGSGEAQEDLSGRSRVSQIVSLTGFSFVGGPAMNDSEAAAEFLGGLNRPFRSVVSLDVQTVEAWQDSPTGLNPVQAGMQIAIPEIDGATEPFIYGGMTTSGAQPVALEERCRRIARRLRRWNHLQTADRASIKLAMLVFCFPPNKGNIGTAADLDVFPSVWETLRRLKQEGYTVEVPQSAEELRALVLDGNSENFGATANVAYRMSVEEYWLLCPHVEEIEAEWGAAPGAINSFGDSLLVQGVMLGNIFLGVQPTFGYEGDPMRMLMSRGSAPHHGFAAFYTYLEKVFQADAVVHVGTHGALEFMPGKQTGLSAECWPDRLIGDLPHVYIYSVNNPSEGSIARRRSYAELISYLTPTIEDAGVYRDLASLKELLAAYRQSPDEREREGLFGLIEEKAATLHFESGG
ncbi:MAG: cobaltochelatase subunit CobN [Acidobacteriota bacterium]|nr:cobaltochelatase subunit CobN [Acidobacteriota bacterium]